MYKVSNEYRLIMKKIILLFFVLQLTFITNRIQAGNNQTYMFQSYLKGDMGYWKGQIDSLRKIKSLSPEEEKKLIMYEYEYIGYLLGQKRNKEAAVYLPDAQQRLKRLLASSENAHLEALMSAFIGYEVGLSPYKAPFISSKCFDYAQNAIRMAPNEPWGFLQMANIKYYAPAVFGGSKEVSLNLFYQAKDRFQKMKSYENTWQYASLLRAIAQNYEALGDYNKALQCYNSILKQYPEYKWVSEVLRPNLLKKMNR